MKLLLVEDDVKLAGHLTSNLREHGFFVRHVASQEELEEGLSGMGNVEAVVLDRLLGNYDAKNSLPSFKKKWPAVPILVLSAISTPDERADLINLGADDYLGKPFSTTELVARLRSLMRRNQVPSGNFLKVGNLVLDLVKRIVTADSISISLPAKEFMLLRALCQEPGRIWSKNNLLDYVWAQSQDVDTHVVEATMANLRKKLLEIGAKVSVKNMRNSGYWIEE